MPRKLMKIDHIITGFPNALQAVVMLISRTLDQVFVYDSCISRGRFFGLIFWSQKVDLYTSKYGRHNCGTAVAAF